MQVRPSGRAAFGPLIALLLLGATVSWVGLSPSPGPGGASTAGPGALPDGTARPDLLRAPAPSASALSCSTTQLCPSTVRSAYGLAAVVGNASRNGTGQTVVVVDACGDSNLASDLKTFDLATGLAAPTLHVYYAQSNPCSNSGWSLETALDVEWAHVVAPGAGVDLVVAAQATTTDLYGAWSYALAHALGRQVSNSWGGSGACGSTASGLVGKAASAGVTILASAGDSGAWGSGTLATAQAPADCAGVLSVGGTTLKVTSAGAYSGETAWGSGGGGYVPSTTEPGYEKKAKLPDPYGELAKPDVAAVANPNTGVWVYNAANGGWLVVGGTSVACPIWAGIVADANSLRASNGFGSLGNFHAYLYLHVYGPSGGSANYSATMHDVTSGSNGWKARIGWDPATGLGSFRAAALVLQLGDDSSA